MALGYINDPEFGATRANMYFNISHPMIGNYPYDSLHTVDSIILSLGYTGFYGDSSSTQTVEVQELDLLSGFNDTTFFRFKRTPDFTTTGTVLGSRSFAVKDLNDSLKITHPRDSAKVANVLRIRLNNSFANTLLAKPNATQADSNVYKSDSAFKVRFRGFAIIANQTGNALSYFNTTTTQTKLIVYYRGTVNGKDSALSTEYYHIPAIPPLVLRNPANFRNGQANLITRTPGSAYASYLNLGMPSDDKIYLQSGPEGSFAHIKIPGLDTFQNSVIHRAELIATKIPSLSENIFYQPNQLLLDKISENADTAIVFQNDLLAGGEIAFENFGGNFKNGAYRFNVTRHVQGIVTRKERNYALRLYAPYQTTLTVPGTTPVPLSLQIITQPAKGRVVLGGGTFADPSKQLRLRIVYSKI